MYFNTKSHATIDDLILEYKIKEFASPTRSTVPLFSLLKHEQLMVSQLLNDLGIPPECSMYLEYQVKPPQGRGNPSHTDLMVISSNGDSALAVEAKWTEPSYDKVSKWISKGNTQNREEVLKGWISLLQKHATRDLHSEDFSDVVYQMLHRAASACFVAMNPTLAYLIFTPSPDPRTAKVPSIKNDLLHLWDILGKPQTFPFFLIEVPLSPTSVFAPLENLPKGSLETANQVSTTLIGKEPLFRFMDYIVTEI